MLPKEHGAWVVLLGPILAGLAAAGPGDAGAVAAFCLVALGAFLTRRPLASSLSPAPESRAVAWTAAYAFPAAATAVWLIFERDRAGLALFAAPALAAFLVDRAFRARGRPLDPLNEAVGVLTLCLGAPAAFYASAGAAPAAAWTTWALCALYFLGPIFRVKLSALGHRAAGDAALAAGLPAARMACRIYHAFAVAVALLFVFRGAAAPWVLLPFAAAGALAWQRAAAAPAKADFRAIGYREVAFAAFFVAVMAAARP